MEEKGNQATIDAMKYREKIEENKYIWINLKGLVKLLGFNSKMIGLQYARSQATLIHRSVVKLMLSLDQIVNYWLNY